MSQTERINQIVNLLEHSRYPVGIERFLNELEISRATFKRDLAYLRDLLGIPVEWQAGETGQRGYVLGGAEPFPDTAGSIQGLWFNESGIHALLTMYELASNMAPGLLSGQSTGLIARIKHLLAHADDDPEDVMARIRIMHSASFRTQSPWFQTVARATLRQRKLEIDYFTRSKGTSSLRTVSPKRLLHYRENWYLLAWCHRSDALRLFALDATSSVEMLPEPAKRVSKKAVDEFVGSGFGIFGGKAKHRAKLRFSKERSRWIKDEVWHRDQARQWDGEHLLLEVPYSHEAEILMEILRHGPDVEVVGPAPLRKLVADKLAEAADRYRKNA
jgi:predicted DNA-binding transcriptional regulator YafY